MPLLDLNTLITSIERRSCAFCNKKLKDAEEIACADPGCFALYYQNLDRLSNDEKKKAFFNIQSKINEFLNCFMGDPAVFKTLNPSVKKQVKNFFAKITEASYFLEEYIHVFIYLFWNDYCILSKESQVFFTAEPKKRPVKLISKESMLVSKLAEDIKVDLISIANDKKTLFFIDIKRDTVDDRTVGQVQRYFNYLHKCLSTQAFKESGILYIKPVLFLRDLESSSWKAFTPHFIENLLVYQFFPNKTRTDIEISDAKAQLISIYTAKS